VDVLEAIHCRHSVREFVDRPVPDEVVQQIIEAGTWAPTSGNMQAWEFVIVKGADAKQKLVDTTDAGIVSRGGVKTQTWILDAPVVVVVCYDVKRMTARYGRKGRELLTILDCMACAENMLLAATALGVGSCPVIGFDPVALKAALPIPAELTPLLLVVLGYAKYRLQAPYRLPLEDVVRLVL
jgi:nitroreductase